MPAEACAAEICATGIFAYRNEEKECMNCLPVREGQREDV